MFSSIWDDIKQQFSYGNTLTRIILVNVGAFVVLTLLHLILAPTAGKDVYNSIREFFCISADWKHNLTHPWVLITHMFLHEDFWHILWNMILLYWFGRIVGDLLGDKRILPIYLICGFAGGLTYFAWAVAVGHTGYALGASAAFMGIIAVAGMTAPDYIISLLFLGNVRLKYIVIFFVFLDIFAISWSQPNTGGHFGHLGGAVMGFILATQLQRGNDLTAPVAGWIESVSNFFQNIFSNDRPKPRMAYKNPKVKQKARAGRAAKGSHASDSNDLSHQEKLDAILDKIKQSGYDSLSKKEKEFLFNASKK